MATIDWEQPELFSASRNGQKEGKAFLINFGKEPATLAPELQQEKNMTWVAYF